MTASPEIQEMAIDEWRRQLEVNLFGHGAVA